MCLPAGRPDFYFKNTAARVGDASFALECRRPRSRRHFHFKKTIACPGGDPFTLKVWLPVREGRFLKSKSG